MPVYDLKPAADRMIDLVCGVPDDLLDAPTPCEGMTLAALLDHVDGLSVAFAAAARKDLESGSGAPSADGSRLGQDWRERIPGNLRLLAEAWAAAEACTGMTRVGGLDLPGEIAGLVAMDELVVHGWDVARASRQPYECDAATLEAVHGFVLGFAQPGASREGLFGPVVHVAEDQPLLDRVIGLTGRHPAW